MVRSEPFQARVVAARALAPSVRELVLERSDGRTMEFEPGQWVNLFVPSTEGGEDLKRAYSIASEPSGDARFELAITRVSGGVASRFLHEIEVGATLRAAGPQGFFTRAASDPEPALFVCTGTGVTPLRSMIRAAVAAGSRAPLTLLFGARHEEDILYRDELEALARTRTATRFEVTLSRPTDAWTGRRGWVQAHVAELYRALEDASGAKPHVFVCGLQRMVDAVRDLTRNELGVERKRVHHERYD